MTPYRIAIVLVATIFAVGCGGGGGSSAPPLPAGTVALSATSYSVAQSAGLLTVTVNRADGSRDGTVAYDTANGTAQAGTDYTARSGTLTWASGDASAKTISLPISNATPNAADKTFTVALSSPTNGLALGSPTRATITVTAGTATAAPAVSVRGNRLVDASGNVVQLRGVSFSGFEFVAISGFNPNDPSGGQAGQPYGPKWSAVKAWNANTVRLTLNETSWLGLTCVDTDGVSRLGDPGGNYRSAVATQVQEANAAGLYVILELHWAAPGNACPMVQTQMANMDHSLDFWTSVATTFKANSSVLFSLYNEPFFYGLASPADPWVALMTGGTISYFPATSGTHNYRNINTPWKSAGMQSMLDAVRATGASNVVLIGGVEFGNNMSNWLANMPRDPLNQMAATWHPYPPIQQPTSATVSSGGTGYAVGDTITLAKPNTVYTPASVRVSAIGAGGAVSATTISEGRYLQTALPTAPVAQQTTSGSGSGATFTLGAWNNLSSTWSMPVNWPVVQALSARLPVIISETGEHNATGTSGAPFLQQLLPFAGASNWSVIGCCWDVFSEQDNVLIKDVDGTPSDGFGRVFYDWMRGTAWQ
ncbi:MAG: cellulase family glycosylhydrolase [Burkholderiaceae bacterium]